MMISMVSAIDLKDISSGKFENRPSTTKFDYASDIHPGWLAFVKEHLTTGDAIFTSWMKGL